MSLLRLVWKSQIMPTVSLTGDISKVKPQLWNSMTPSSSGQCCVTNDTPGLLYILSITGNAQLINCHLPMMAPPTLVNLCFSYPHLGNSRPRTDCYLPYILLWILQQELKPYIRSFSISLGWCSTTVLISFFAASSLATCQTTGLCLVISCLGFHRTKRQTWGPLRRSLSW